MLVSLFFLLMMPQCTIPDWVFENFLKCFSETCFSSDIGPWIFFEDKYASKLHTYLYKIKSNISGWFLVSTLPGCKLGFCKDLSQISHIADHAVSLSTQWLHNSFVYNVAYLVSWWTWTESFGGVHRSQIQQCNMQLWWWVLVWLLF